MSLRNPFVSMPGLINIHVAGAGSTYNGRDHIREDTSDRVVVQAARRLFGFAPEGTVTLTGSDKEAFMTLCFDLWEEAHGKSR